MANELHEQIRGNTLTVGQVRRLLADFGDDVPFVVTSDYGDRCHTEQIHYVKDEAFGTTRQLSLEVSKTGYSASGLQVSEPDEFDDTADKVLLLRL